MGRRVFDTYHALEDEVDGVKGALDDAGIAWYETHRGRWWVGSAALWVERDTDHARARAVIDGFQERWVAEQRAGFEAKTGGIRWGRVPVALVVIGVLVYLMTFWFWL